MLGLLCRYQYLSLIYFLEKGTWPAPYGGVDGEPSVCNEHEWPRWAPVTLIALVGCLCVAARVRGTYNAIALSLSRPESGI
jgi:hypothetical protein